MNSILFVCTGNVFRSMTAEYALRAHLGPISHVSVSSAGTRDDPKLTVRDDVASYLETKGLGVAAHKRTLITAELINDADRVIAMNVDHKLYLKEKFSVTVPHKTCPVRTREAAETIPLRQRARGWPRQAPLAYSGCEHHPA